MHTSWMYCCGCVFALDLRAKCTIPQHQSMLGGVSRGGMPLVSDEFSDEAIELWSTSLKGEPVCDSTGYELERATPKFQQCIKSI